MSGKDIPKPLVDTLSYDLDNFDESTESAEFDDVSPDYGVNLGQQYARKLNLYMSGYRQFLDANDTISIMAIDSATPGRMSITYYREILPVSYLAEITKWHTEFCWFQRVAQELRQPKGKPKTRVMWTIGAPSPSAILQAIYGDILKSNNTLKKNFYERIMPCVLEGRALPADFVKLCVRRASNPYGKEYWEWEKSLGIACALYRGSLVRHSDTNQRMEVSMALDTTCSSRDYLYGRLLALAERIEDKALYVSSVTRPTTAQRLMQRFADRPYSTWPTIYKQLDPYIRQLKTSRAGFLTNMLKEIDVVMGQFKADDFTSDKSLSGEFLLGFHCQRLTLRSAKEPAESIED